MYDGNDGSGGSAIAAGVDFEFLKNIPNNALFRGVARVTLRVLTACEGKYHQANSI
jgi:hypothetical protein